MIRAILAEALKSQQTQNFKVSNMLEELPKMDTLIFFVLSFVWLRFSFLHHKRLSEIIQENKKESIKEYEERSKAFVVFQLISGLGVFAFAYILSKEYSSYPNLVLIYTLFCLVVHLGFDFHEHTARTTFEIFEKEEH